MSNGRNRVLNHCSQYSYSDLDYIQSCLDNERAIKEGRYRDLEGCPSSFGLEEFLGLCYEDTVEDYLEQRNQCEMCWKQALGVSE